MKLVFEINDQVQTIASPAKGHFNDSGIDIFNSTGFTLKNGERMTIPLNVRFELKFPWYLKFLHLMGLGVEAQVRPKSGRSKDGIEISFGTIDEGYRNFTSATVVNNSGKTQSFVPGEKICQIVFVPVFNRLKLIEGKVNTNTSRGLGGFGSTGLLPKKRIDNTKATEECLSESSDISVIKMEAPMPVKNSSKPTKGSAGTKKPETPKDPKMKPGVPSKGGKKSC